MLIDVVIYFRLFFSDFYYVQDTTFMATKPKIIIEFLLPNNYIISPYMPKNLWRNNLIIINKESFRSIENRQ